MAIALVLLLVLLATATDARAGDHRRGLDHLRLPSTELVTLLGSQGSREAPHELSWLSDLEQLTKHEISLAPFFTLLAPLKSLAGARDEGMMPLVAFGARVRGRTLVAFTRPGAKHDPDDRIVYQRLVASDLFEGRRFSVTVFEDHALGPNASQLLGFGARFMLRPALEFHGWRARVEIFTSYDVTKGATGYIGIIGRPPGAPPPAH